MVKSNSPLVGLNFMILMGFVFSTIIANSNRAMAQMIEIPEEELPTESVSANLDNPSAVINRALSFKNRLMTEITTGWILDEPFYGNQFVGVLAEYCWSESHGLGLHYMDWFGGLSTYASQFNSLNFQAAAGPSRGLTLFYENRLIYGKLSLGKDFVFPTTFRWFLEGGEITYRTRSLPMVAIGLGNMLYLNHGWGIHLDVRYILRQEIDPLSQNITGSSPTPSLDQFKAVTRTNTGLELGATYLF